MEENNGAAKSRSTAHAIQSVGRALDLLEALSREELGLVELGRRAGLQPSTTHRMLATLSERGYVSRRPSGLFALGRRAGYLGVGLCAREQAIKVAARPVMQRVQMVSRQTVNLTVLDGEKVVFVAYLWCSDRLKEARSGEVRLPAHVSASGKVLMAFASGGRRRPAVPLEAYTRNTITENQHLGAELDEIRARGWAFECGEWREHIACVAAPIFGGTGEVVAGLSVAGPDDVVASESNDLAELLVDAAYEISEALGYHDDEAGERLAS